jgi:hypothetical protein
LKAEGVDVDRAIQQDTFMALDAPATSSMGMVDGLSHPVRFLVATEDFIEAVSKKRIVLCGEGVDLLRAEGKTDAAIRIEQLCNVIVKTHEVDVLCAYPLVSFHGVQMTTGSKVSAQKILPFVPDDVGYGFLFLNSRPGQV